jgi:bifunctional non-homologous end joining protein LigD
VKPPAVPDTALANKKRAAKIPKSIRSGEHSKFAHYIRPMLARLHEGPFDDPDWIFEIKWDGYRAIAEIGDKETRLYSRNGLSFKDLYPIVFEELKNVKHPCILDSEIVALDKDGLPRFQLLQQYMTSQTVQLCYYVFDCLSVNGQSIEDRPLLERKEILKTLLPESEVIRYCDHIAERGKDFFAAVTAKHLEGMVAKRADSRYVENARPSDWLKVKNVVEEEAVIAGYTEPQGSRKYFGALVLGIYKNGKLTYIGHTGTGFTEKSLKEVYRQLQPLVTEESPFDKKVPVNGRVTWVRPQLVCNLKYGEITTEGIRRIPVFLGLRLDKDANEVQPEVTDNHSKKRTNKKSIMTKYAAKAESHPQEKEHDETKTIDGEDIMLSHLSKVFWPNEGYTKGDVVDYYEAIWPYMEKYLKDRPESLLRMPNGIIDKGFFHKDAGEHVPQYVKTESLWSESAEKDIHYIICNNRPTLLYMANLGCIEINPWNSRLNSLDNPDYLIMDLDPSDNNTYDQVVETALVIRDVLDKAGAVSYPKTSGASGIHVYVPLGAQYDYEHAKEFAHVVASLAHEQLPGITTLERSLSKRSKDQIYIDYLQNRRGQTLACAYSIRPKPGATVSTPLEWKEVKKGLLPTDFTFKNIMKRLEKKGDLFEGVLGKGVDIKKCLKNLG